MERVAVCSCGQLSVKMTGKPGVVLACNCFECQKRTGNVFGTSSYWPKSSVVSITGEKKLYRRTSGVGRWIESYFCPTCGSCVYWYAEWGPDSIGIAVGNFADPNFEPPTQAVWCENKHAWVKFPETCEEFPRGLGGRR